MATWKFDNTGGPGTPQGYSPPQEGYSGIIGVIWDNGKENGNYYLGLRV